MRHTRDNTIWISNERFTIEDVQSVVPSYELPDGFSHTEEDCGFIEEGNEINQVALPSEYVTMASIIDAQLGAIQTARDNRLAAEAVQEATDNETAAQAAFDALSVSEKRKVKYNEEWTADEFQEALIENAAGDSTKLDAIVTKRNAIRATYS